MGDHPQRFLFPAASNHHWNLAYWCRVVHHVLDVVVLASQGGTLILEHRNHDLKCFFQLFETISERTKFDSEIDMFTFEPAGS